MGWSRRETAWEKSEKREDFQVHLVSPSSPESPDPTLFIEPITEERASRTLYRIDLLRRLREQVLCHPLLEERLALCQPPGPEMPPWWQCGRHDGELLRGVARHGLSQTDTTIMQDPDFSFLAARLSHLHSRAGGTGTPPLPPPVPAQPTGLPLPGVSTAAAPSPLLLAPPLNEPPAPQQPLALPPKPESAEDSDSELDLSKISASSSCSSSSGCSDDSEGELLFFFKMSLLSRSYPEEKMAQAFLAFKKSGRDWR